MVIDIPKMTNSELARLFRSMEAHKPLVDTWSFGYVTVPYLEGQIYGILKIEKRGHCKAESVDNYEPAGFGGFRRYAVVVVLDGVVHAFGKNKEFCVEPRPSDRSQEYLANYRYDSFRSAFYAAVGLMRKSHQYLHPEEAAKLQKRDKKGELIKNLALSLERYRLIQRRILEEFGSHDDNVLIHLRAASDELLGELWVKLHACEADAIQALNEADEAYPELGIPKGNTKGFDQITVHEG